MSEEFGYVGRRRECHCAVMFTVDLPQYVENAAEALYGGLYLERLPIEEMRKNVRLGCNHGGGERMESRGGRRLWRVETAVIVAADDEDAALDADIDDNFHASRRAIPIDPAILDARTTVVVDDGREMTIEEWTEEPLTEEEQARAYRLDVERQGQQRLKMEVGDAD